MNFQRSQYTSLSFAIYFLFFAASLVQPFIAPAVKIRPPTKQTSFQKNCLKNAAAEF